MSDGRQKPPTDGIKVAGLLKAAATTERLHLGRIANFTNDLPPARPTATGSAAPGPDQRPAGNGGHRGSQNARPGAAVRNGVA